jgi:two-component system cell cycle response regulator
MTARILVVDDIDANVRLLEAKLSAEYYEVLTASDGASGLIVAGEEKPDIILLDVMMPAWTASRFAAGSRTILPPATSRWCW